MQYNWNPNDKKMKPERQISRSLFKWYDGDGNKYLNSYATFETIGRGRFGKVKRCYQMYDSTLRSDKSLIVDEDILSQSLRKISFFESALVQQKRSKSYNSLDRLCSRETRILAAKIVSKRLLKRIKTYQWNEKLKKMTTRSALDNIRGEIQLMRHFTHENVVHLYDVVDDQREDKIYIIMEFMKNGECMRFDSVNRKFKSPITKTVLPEYLACRHIKDILHGLRYLHDMGVAHCDLKPENILIDSSFRCRITDFGCAVYKPEKGALVSSTCGTYHFFSPECCSGDPYDPFLADMWAVGILLYIFVNGELPFKAEHTGLLFEEIAQHEITIYPSILSELGVDFLTKLLVKDPRKRMSANEALVHPWISRFAHNSTEAREQHVEFANR